MKTLSNYISEKLVINKDYKNDEPYFIYNVDDATESKIAIFDNTWSQFDDYKDKVYIDDEHVEIDNSGFTTKGYSKGKHKVEIKNIDNIYACGWMFLGCWQLIEVPYFNTKKVENMEMMFYHCKNLKKVPLFDTSKVTNMKKMFSGCNNLSDDTKKQWSQIYDFFKGNKRK